MKVSRELTLYTTTTYPLFSTSRCSPETCPATRGTKGLKRAAAWFTESGTILRVTLDFGYFLRTPKYVYFLATSRRKNAPDFDTKTAGRCCIWCTRVCRQKLPNRKKSVYIYGDEARPNFTYPIEHGPSSRSEFGKAPSPRKLLEKQPCGRYFESGLLGRPPGANKPPSIGGPVAVRRRLLRVWGFGPSGDSPRSRQKSILRARGKADSSQNFVGGAKSPGRPAKKHKNLAHRACKHKRLQNPGNNCENRERNRAAGKKAVEKALPGEGGLCVFHSKNRRVRGRDHPAAGVPANACQTPGKPRRRHVPNRIPRTSPEW